MDAGVLEFPGIAICTSIYVYLYCNICMHDPCKFPACALEESYVRMGGRSLQGRTCYVWTMMGGACCKNCSKIHWNTPHSFWMIAIFGFIFRGPPGNHGHTSMDMDIRTLVVSTCTHVKTKAPYDARF